ncbi:MAG TPA: ABC transporter substrate-binding protein [Actinomycetota bacterium]|jgi:peptide/nickel transport system substrate-binding protein|nr:ABC transporter substrate-binding protein [Actinomycetota bacterium]
MLHRRVLRVVLLACVAVVAGFGATANARNDASHTLVVDTSFGIASLDPTFGQTLARLVSHSRWDTLLTYVGSSLDPKPLLATGYTASKDLKTFTFTMRPGTKFADGTALTAADVVFSFQRGQALKGDAASLLTGITVSSPVRNKVVLRSETPNGAIPAIVTSPLLSVLNSDVAKAHGATTEPGKDTAGPWLTSPASQGSGSGPFTLVQYDVNSQIILGRNLKYWGKRPAYDKIVIRNVPTQTQALNVQRGTEEVALDLGAQDVSGIRGNSKLKFNTAASPQTFLFFFNNDPAISPISANKQLQQAARASIDYAGVIALAGAGARRPGGVIPAFFPGALPAKDLPKRDLAAARRLISQSGVSKPKISIEFPSDRAINGLSFTSVAQKIQANLQEAGFDVDLAGEPVTTVLSRYLGGKIAFGIVPNLPTVQDPQETLRFLPGGFLGNIIGWKAGADNVMTAAAAKAQLLTGDKRNAAWQNVQKLQQQRGPWIPLVNPSQNVVYTNDVTGIAYNPAWIIDFRLVKPAKA